MTKPLFLFCLHVYNFLIFIHLLYYKITQEYRKTVGFSTVLMLTFRSFCTDFLSSLRRVTPLPFFYNLVSHLPHQTFSSYLPLWVSGLMGRTFPVFLTRVIDSSATSLAIAKCSSQFRRSGIFKKHNRKVSLRWF